MPTAPFLNPGRDDAAVLGRAKGGGTTYYGVPGTAGSSTTSSTAADTDYYFPWWTPTPIVIDQLACAVTTVNSGTVARIGLYRADRDWQPTGAPLADSGDLTTSGTGTKTYTPSSPLYLPRGRYLSVLNSDTGTTVFTVMFGTLAGVSSTISSGVISRLAVARAYAAFPTPGTAWDTVITGNGPNNHMVFFRVTAP